MLHFLHNRLCVSAADVVEITTPESDFVVLPGDAYHRTDTHYSASQCLVGGYHIYSMYSDVLVIYFLLLLKLPQQLCKVTCVKVVIHVR